MGLSARKPYRVAWLTSVQHRAEPSGCGLFQLLAFFSFPPPPPPQQPTSWKMTTASQGQTLKVCSNVLFGTDLSVLYHILSTITIPAGIPSEAACPHQPGPRAAPTTLGQVTDRVQWFSTREVWVTSGDIFGGHNGRRVLLAFEGRPGMLLSVPQGRS